MHIPDGYLSPETCGAFGAVMVPVWLRAGRRVRRVVTSRYVPLLAFGAAYCFVVMMFNVPIPDGTTAHAVGGVLIAVLLGPEAAVVAVSTALVIQALFFGDGGVLAFGANAFNMAFVMPTVGYGIYRLLSSKQTLTSSRRPVAAGIGAYVGLNVAALCAAIEFGVQPILFHSADGTPLYAPFHLSQTIPAMVGAHLIVGGVEAALTAGVVAYLQRANLPVLRINHPGIPVGDGRSEPSGRPAWRWAAVGLGAMVVLVPVGLLAPGRAFGEDRPSNLDISKYHLDAVPDGLRRYAGFWHDALFSRYDFAGDSHPVLGYLISALVGVAAIAAIVLIVVQLARLVGSARGRGRGPGRSEADLPDEAVTDLVGFVDVPEAVGR